MNDSETKLKDEILADAKRRADRLTKRAERDASKEIDAVKEEHKDLAEKRLEEARKQAEDRRRAIAAGIEHEITKRWLNMREARLEALFDDLLQQLEARRDIDSARSLQQLLIEALSALGPTTVTVRAGADCASILDDALIGSAIQHAWNEESGSAAAASVTVEVDENVRSGLIAISADKRKRFDNTYATRLARLHDNLRALVSEPSAEAREET